MFTSIGVTLSKLNQPEGAIIDFSAVLEINPQHINAAFARAACFNTIGKINISDIVLY